MPEKEMIVYDWAHIDALDRELARRIQESGFVPDVIVGILRGGLVSATHLAYLLGVKNLFGIRVSRFDENEKDLPVPIVKWYVPEEEISGKNILLVDSVIASGTSANLSLEKLQAHHPASVKVATLIDWPDSPLALKYGTARPHIDYSAEVVHVWPDFPWEH